MATNPWYRSGYVPFEHAYYWNTSAETYYPIGEAMGNAMVKLCEMSPAAK